jgi:hypothetical protein
MYTSLTLKAQRLEASLRKRGWVSWYLMPMAKSWGEVARVQMGLEWKEQLTWQMGNWAFGKWMIYRVWSSRKKPFHGILKSFAGDSEALMGTVNNNLATALVDDVDPEFVVRSVDWFEKLVNIDNNLGAGSFALLEIMQKVSQS